MVDTPRLITPEIAEAYGVSLHTVTKTWARHPQWPDPVDKRGRYNEYTARELEAAGIGITASTIRADRARDRWPAPDDTTGGVNRWTGATAAQALEGRRGYRRTLE
jgi:uncharacterized protein YjcR